MTEYTEWNDSELIQRYRDGDLQVMDFLLKKYKDLVRKKAHALFLIGGDTDDLIQEGMIGLFKAIRNYDESGGSFYHFAEICISRQIYTAIESAARKKHGPLNSYISLSQQPNTQEKATVDGKWAAQIQNPEQIVIDKENLEDFLERIYQDLSPTEKQVLDYHLQGLNYRVIASEMGKSEKSIDNALQRIKAKVQRLLQKQNL